MERLILLSAAEQVAAHLRRELIAGRWSGRIPGADRLAKELGVGRDSVDAALKRLDREGLLVNQGRRRGRRIGEVVAAEDRKKIRVAVLLFSHEDRGIDYMLRMEHELTERGHEVVYPRKTLIELGMNVERVAGVVSRTEADAWIVQAGSREVLEWFAAREAPVMAMFGRRRSLPIASVGPEKIPAIRATTRRLLGLGHRRIVFLTRRVNREPEPATAMRAFIKELEAHGINVGPYHLPDWEESVAGLDARLKSLFRVTPPTAMIIDEAPFFVAVRHFLGLLKLAVPEDVSLVCTDDDPAFAWCTPQVAHIRWDRGMVARRITQWVSNITKGKKDSMQSSIPAEFVSGETIGPVKIQ